MMEQMPAVQAARAAKLNELVSEYVASTYQHTTLKDFIQDAIQTVDGFETLKIKGGAGDLDSITNKLGFEHWGNDRNHDQRRISDVTESR